MQYTFQKVGIVKYDAFHEMGGKLSFAICMLDKNDNGCLVNVMHSNNGCFAYIKEVVDGKKVTVYDEVEKKASLGASVTEVLSWVAEGSADAGIVYATDAQTENTNGDDKEVEIVATAEDSMMQTPVIYPVGTVSSSAHKDEAKAFEDFLQTDEAKAILEKAGFTINE